MTTVSGPFLEPTKLGIYETGTYETPHYTVSVPMIISVFTTFTRARAAMVHAKRRRAASTLFRHLGLTPRRARDGPEETGQRRPNLGATQGI
jgi:hypothetical protein